MSDALECIDDTRKDWTYADYVTWDDGVRREIIKGEVFMMAGPTTRHQRISRELLLQFGNYLKGKPCEIFAAPLDVRLCPRRDRSDNIIVQPDLLVVCDKSKIGVRSCDGPPDLVIEIVSSSNTQSHLFMKFIYYLEAGVREYWIVDPEQQIVQVHLLEDGRYVSTAYRGEKVIPVSILPGLSIDLKTLWDSAP